MSDYTIARHENALASTFDSINSRLESIDDRLGGLSSSLAEIQLRSGLAPDPGELEAISDFRNELDSLIVKVDAQANQIDDLLFLITLALEALGVQLGR